MLETDGSALGTEAKPPAVMLVRNLLGGIVLLLGLGTGCLPSETPSEPVPFQAEGTRRMAHRLALIADTANPEANPFLNAERIALFRQLPPPEEKGPQVQAAFRLARELLVGGHTPEAIERLLQLHTQITPHDFNPQFIRPQFIRKVQHFLAVAYLRLGEQENCLRNHTGAACLLPVGEEGIHTKPHGSRQAMQHYLALLQDDPTDLNARWLLNLAAMTIGAYPEQVPTEWRLPPSAFDSDADIGQFKDSAPALGLDAVGLAGGSILEDLDGDGHLDVMVSSWGLRDQLRYFRNTGDGSFTEQTQKAGLTGIVGGLNLIHADYDNDGHTDILVLRGAWLGPHGRHPNSLLRNRGDGTFEDVTEAAGVLSFRPTQTAAWGDFDNDGWLDLFIGNESLPGDSQPCQLFRNTGDGTFEERAEHAGVAVGGYVKGVVWGDYDNDGLLDLYLSRLREPNILFRNTGPDATGRWMFQDVTTQAGVGEPLHSFPTWFWDYNNDGWLDLFVSGYELRFDQITVANVAADYLGMPHSAELPRVYKNNGNGTFTDVAEQLGLARALYTMGGNFGDLDNDGFSDVYLGTGAPSFRALMPNRMFHNKDGQTFQDVTTSGGVGHLQKGHGISFGDIDNDGDQDIYAVMGGAYSGDVFQNALFINPGHGKHWLTLRLEGVAANRSAIGTRIRVTTITAGIRRDIYATVSTGGSFGASSLQQEIGLGDAERIEQLEIRWPGSGLVQRFDDVPMDHILTIREGAARSVSVHSERG